MKVSWITISIWACRSIEEIRDNERKGEGNKWKLIHVNMNSLAIDKIIISGCLIIIVLTISYNKGTPTFDSIFIIWNPQMNKKK